MKDSDELPKASELRASVEKMSATEFAKANPRPALHLTLEIKTKTGESDGNKSTKERSYERTAVIPPSGAGIINRYHDRIAFLAKRPGNPFPNMISVGRALNNDVVIVLSTVSKLHGYFLNDGAAWSFYDHGSKNGTQLNGAPVKPNERRPIAPGDRIRLGLELQCVFLSPEKLYDFLRRSSSGALP